MPSFPKGRPSYWCYVLTDPYSVGQVGLFDPLGYRDPLIGLPYSCHTDANRLRFGLLEPSALKSFCYRVKEVHVHRIEPDRAGIPGSRLPGSDHSYRLRPIRTRAACGSFRKGQRFGQSQAGFGFRPSCIDTNNQSFCRIMSHIFSTLGADHYSLISLETSVKTLLKTLLKTPRQALWQALLGIRSFHRSGLDSKPLGPLVPYTYQALEDLRLIESKVDCLSTIVR